MKPGIVSLLFPPKCIGCRLLYKFEGFTGEEISALCKSCQGLWVSEKLASCGCCGKAVSLCSCMTEAQQKANCLSLRKLVYYRQGAAYPVQNRILYRIKNRPDRRTAEFLASELAPLLFEMLKEFELEVADTVMVYIPRGRAAVLKTGTDQAKQLALSLQKQTGIPPVKAICRIGSSKQQKQLSPRERQKNAKNAYRLVKEPQVKDKNVVLLDDIVTTGATMAAAAKLLHRAGAKAVLCLAVASDDRNQSGTVRQPTFKI